MGWRMGQRVREVNEAQCLEQAKVAERLLKYAVFITYTHTPNIAKVYDHVTQSWQDAKWPLLLILIDVEKSKRFSIGKQFKDIRMSIFAPSGRKDLRTAPAFPWKIEGSRWYSRAP
jgi:hypothetical protein